MIEEKLSSGGEGELFVGRQPGLDRRVLLRKLRRDLLGATTLVERFRREARLAARVQHAGVIQVFDFFAERGDHYLVLEHVEGPSLSAVLERMGKLPPRIALRIALELARSLEELHRRGIVHTELSPARVWISRWGEVKLGGLGGAQEISETDPPSREELTAYSAPELRQGGAVDSRADVYSLGVLLCELISGRPGRDGLRAVALTSASVARQLRRCLQERPSARPELAALRRSLERATARGKADARIETAAWLFEVRVLRPQEPAARRTAERSGANPEAREPFGESAEKRAVQTQSPMTRPRVPAPNLGGVLGPAPGQPERTRTEPAPQEEAERAEPTPHASGDPAQTVPDGGNERAEPAAAEPRPAPRAADPVAGLPDPRHIRERTRGARDLGWILAGAAGAAAVALAVLMRGPEGEGLAGGRAGKAETLPPVASAVSTPAAEPPPPPEIAAPEKTEKGATEPELGSVLFVAVPWAEIQIDGGESFFTPRAAPVELSPGRHEIVFRHPRYGSVERRVRLKPGESRIVRHVFDRGRP